MKHNVAAMRRWRWLSFGLVVTGYALAFFHRIAPATLAADLQQAFATSGAGLGMLAAVYFYVYGALQLPVGVLTDTVGPRLIASSGALAAGLGALLFGLAESLPVAMVGRFLIGFGFAAMYLCTIKLLNAWFDERQFATVTGLTVLIGNMGGVLAGTPLAELLRVVSWRQVMFAAAALTMLLGVAIYVLVRNRPQDAGFPSLRALAGQAEHPLHQGHWWQGLQHVARNRHTWPGFWINFGIVGSMFTFVGLWCFPYMRDVYGYDRANTGYLVTSAFMGYAICSLFSGLLSDKLGKRKPVIIAGTLIYALCWLPFAVDWRLPGWALFIVFAGFGAGAAGVLTTFASVKENNNPALSGMASGLINTGLFLGAALLQPLVGWVLDLGWQGQSSNGVRLYDAAAYQAAFVAIGVVVLGAALASLWVRETHCRFVEPHAAPALP